MNNTNLSVAASNTNQANENASLLNTVYTIKLLRNPELYADKMDELATAILKADERIEAAEAKEKACEQTIVTMHAEANVQIAERKMAVEQELQLKEQKANEQANQVKDAADAYRLDVQNQMYQLSVNTQTRCAQMEREAKERADKIIADAEAIKEEAAKDWTAAKADKLKAQQLLKIAES